MNQNNVSNNAAQLQPQKQDEMLIFIKNIFLIWKCKWFIILLTFVFTLCGIFYALEKKTMYSSSVIIAPKEAQKNFSDNILSQMGGFGSLVAAQAGIGNTSLDRMAVLLKSHDIIKKAILRNNLLPIVFFNKYDNNLGKWKISDSSKIPSTQEGVRKIQKSLLIVSTDTRKNIITVKISLSDSIQCKIFLDTITQLLDRRIRKDIISDANNKKHYLESQLKKTADPWLSQKIQNLIGVELEKSVIVAGKSFDILESPSEPQRDRNPSRKIIVILSFLLGIFLSTSFAIFWSLVIPEFKSKLSQFNK